MTDLTHGAPQRPTSPRSPAEVWTPAYESLTFTLVTRARRELSVTLAAQPVFDLQRGRPVSRRIRRTVRHVGGEAALALTRGTVEAMDLKRIDLQTLRHGLDLLRLDRTESGVLPAFWRTVASSGGRFALLCAELQHGAAPGVLLMEVMGGVEQAPRDALEEAISHFETAALGVVLHVAPDLGAVRRLGGCLSQCLALDFAGVAHDSLMDWEAAVPLIAAAREACGQVLLLNLRPDRAQAAARAGATHAVFRELTDLRV